MRPRLVATLLLASFWGCDAGGEAAARRLPAEVPEARLASAEARQRGRRLFLRHCALCHGERADGQGMRRNLSSRPVDFTDPSWRERTPETRIWESIRYGVRGTAMPAWKILDEDETWDLVAYLLSVPDGAA